MKILVTDTAGSVGSRVAMKLLECGDEVIGIDNLSDYHDTVIVAVGRQPFVATDGTGIRAFGKAKSVVYDVKHALPRDAVDRRL